MLLKRQIADGGRPPLGRHAAVFAIVMVSLLAMVVSASPFSGDETPGGVAVIFPPWRSQASNILTVAEVSPVMGVGALPFVVFTTPTTSRQHADLLLGGAVMVVDAAAMRWCASKSGDI